MRIAVTPADQELARLDVALAERLGEEVDPRVKIIADADLSPVHAESTTVDRLPDDAPSTDALFIDDSTGEPVAVLKYLDDNWVGQTWRRAADHALSTELRRAERSQRAARPSEGHAPSG